MKPVYELVKKPLITEKGMMAKEAYNRYSFEVALTATKPAIRTAIESYFKVKVESVHTMIVRGHLRRMGRHTGRRSNWKKAIVTLAQGQKIELFEVK